MEVNEQGLKQILSEQREEYQRYLGVLTESFESQVKLIAESIGGVERQLIALRDIVVKNAEDIEMIKMDIEVMKTELSLIRHDLKEKVGRDEFSALEGRVARLEKSARRK